MTVATILPPEDYGQTLPHMAHREATQLSIYNTVPVNFQLSSMYLKAFKQISYVGEE